MDRSVKVHRAPHPMNQWVGPCSASGTTQLDGSEPVEICDLNMEQSCPDDLNQVGWIAFVGHDRFARRGEVAERRGLGEVTVSTEMPQCSVWPGSLQCTVVSAIFEVIETYSWS